MRVTITSDVLATSYDGSAITPEWAREYIAGAESMIVPGVVGWDNVTARGQQGDDGEQIVISADLTTLLVVADDDPSGNAGQEVSEAFVKDYITGADAYWLAPEVLVAREVTFA